MLNVVIFGAPGSGKGTQSELIIKEYGLDHISTGDVLRSEMKNERIRIGSYLDGRRAPFGNEERNGTGQDCQGLYRKGTACARRFDRKHAGEGIG